MQIWNQRKILSFKLYPTYPGLNIDFGWKVSFDRVSVITYFQWSPEFRFFVWDLKLVYRWFQRYIETWLLTIPWAIRYILPKRSKNDHFFGIEKKSSKHYFFMEQTIWLYSKHIQVYLSGFLWKNIHPLSIYSVFAKKCQNRHFLMFRPANGPNHPNFCQ